MTVDHRRRDTQVRWILGAALFASYAYFYEAGGWNQNSRFALVTAIVERHSVRIDRYADWTRDRALWRGHYYSDKAPGSALLAIVPVALARAAARIVRVDPASRPGIAWSSYVATVATSGVFTVVAALCVFWLSQLWGFSQNAATFATLAYGVATPAWCYATLFMGHGQTAGCVMLAFAAAVAIDRTHMAARARFAWTVGLASGWAVVTEFPAAVPAILIVLLAVAAARDGHERLAVIWRIAAGGTIAAAVLLGYNQLAFRSPFHLGYQSEEGFEHLNEGLFGITHPTWFRIRELLFGSYRGLLPIAPLVALTPIGLYFLARRPPTRRAALVAATIGAFYVLLNASYYYWEGGWAYGPRQLTPGLPFLALGLAPLWDRWHGFARSMLVVLWIWGASLTFIAVATTPQPPSTVQAPVRELLWPAFRDGDLSLNNQGFTDLRAHGDALRDNAASHVAWNLGELAGLHGHASLIPLLIVWATTAFVLKRTASAHESHQSVG